MLAVVIAAVGAQSYGAPAYPTPDYKPTYKADYKPSYAKGNVKIQVSYPLALLGFLSVSQK